MTSAIRKDSTPAEVLTVTGEVVQTSGTIYLAWKLSPTRVYRSRFFVLSGARHLDVILGQDTISEDNLLSSDSPRLVASFTSRKPLTKGEDMSQWGS